MSDPWKQVLTRPAFDRRGPTDEVGAPTEENKHTAVALSRRLKPALDLPAACSSVNKCRGWSNEALSSFHPQTTGFRATLRVGLRSPNQRPAGKVGLVGRRLSHLYCPEGTSDCGDILRGCDFLVPQKFRPRPVRRVTEVVHRTLAVIVPPRGRLLRALPKEGKSWVGVSKDDHVAAAATRDRARSRTFLGAGSVGLHSLARSAMGDRFSKTVRFRSNQRRIPISL